MIFDMPQIPFEVYDSQYNKTIEVVASCDKTRKDTITLTFQSTDGEIVNVVLKTVDRAFDKPGITKVQICRKGVK